MKSSDTKEKINKKNKRLSHHILGIMACSFYGLFVLMFAILNGLTREQKRRLLYCIISYSVNVWFWLCHGAHCMMFFVKLQG